MRLSEIQPWLSERGIRLTKSLGQNFLHDGNQLRRIVRAAELGAGDRVLEIGPGLGALTGPLLETGARVRAIEKDERLAKCLRERLGAAGDLELVEADALDYLRESGRDWGGWKLVSNLPYSVGSPILVELALNPAGPERMVVTLQLEVIERLLARAGDGNFGLLTVLVGLNYEARGWFKVPAGCFFPVPEVDSACVTLVRRADGLVRAGLTGAFVRIVKRGFSQRRKMLLKLLRQDWPIIDLERTFQRLGLAKEVRAETVSVEQWAALTVLLAAGQEPSQ
ncbi:MAG: ribosomal RNA small subunit methyltransferase A [Verrucomicrobia bacterium]|nr:ribosomal RNA small subunit methyltransferase A [Verrucomicrobiota bacterium]